MSKTTKFTPNELIKEAQNLNDRYDKFSESCKIMPLTSINSQAAFVLGRLTEMDANNELNNKQKELLEEEQNRRANIQARAEKRCTCSIKLD